MKSKKSNISGTSAVDGGSVPPPLPIETDLTRAQAETNLSPFLSPIETDLTRAQAKKELCFLKFYTCLDENKKKQWRDNFRENMSGILLSKGYQNLNLMFSYLCKQSVKWRIIYSHRHMGATSLLRAIETVWTGTYKGERNYYSEDFQNKPRRCKLISFDKNENMEDRIVKFLENNLKKWVEKLPNKPKDNCPCEAVEETIIGEIQAEILKYVEDERGSALARTLNGETLLLLDDLDVHLCELYKSNNETYKSYKIWFYRKCWINAILKINKEHSDIAVVLVLLTKLREYKAEDDEENVFSYLGDNKKLEYSESIFDLYRAYNSIINSFKDACFFKCKPYYDINMYTCEGEDMNKKCRFALTEDYWHEDSVPENKIDSTKVKYIQDKVLNGRHKNVNNNPWWEIVPLTHVIDPVSACLYDDIDSHLKIYYREGTDISLKDRAKGKILDEFFATLPLYCQVKCSFTELLKAKDEYKAIIIDRLTTDIGDAVVVVLKRGEEISTDSPTGRKPNKIENKMLKTMLEDSGLVVRINNECAKKDKFNLHPFVCYVYSDNEKYFEKE